MFKDLLRFSFFLFLAAGISYALHLSVLSNLISEGPSELVNFAYKFNIGFTFVFTSALILVSQRLKDQIGFVFLFSGMIKLGVFFYLIKTSDFNLNKSLFLHIFIPYVVCVVVEILYLSRILHRTNFSEDK